MGGRIVPEKVPVEDLEAKQRARPVIDRNPDFEQ